MGAPLHAEAVRRLRRRQRARRLLLLTRRGPWLPDYKCWLSDLDRGPSFTSARYRALFAASMTASRGLEAGGDPHRIWRKLRRLVWSWLRREPGHPTDTTMARARDLVRDELAEDSLTGWVWHCSDRWNLSRLHVADALFERDYA